MFRLLILCLIWLSSAHSETSMPMSDAMMMEDKSVMPKREAYYNPCPPSHSHPISYSPPPQIYVKPYVHPAPMPYIHQASYPVVQKPVITYVKPTPQPVVIKPAPQPVVVKPVVPAKLIYPVAPKPMISYAPVYQKPVYYQPMYQKVMYEQPKVYLKKLELPVTQVIQKPQISYHQPVQYHQPKVIQVAPTPQVSYVKLAQPVHPQPVVHQTVYQPAVKPWCP